MLEEKLRGIIKEVQDFPTPGIGFKDLSPLLQQPMIWKEISAYFCSKFSDKSIDAVAAIESRGFWFGILLAEMLSVPLIPVRKAGKLPGNVISCSYSLEYGSACIEMQSEAVKPGANILIHDDVLATGGTAEATAQLIHKAGAEIAGFTFIAELGFLKGREKLQPLSPVISIVNYQ
ncbi:MAG: adenine phosphoribosyltransferase [Cytophagaceae bacterium]